MVAGAFALFLHVFFKTFGIGAETALFGHVGNDVQGKAIGVIQLEAEVAGNQRRAAGLEGGQFFFEQIQPLLEREGEALLFLKHGAVDKVGAFHQFGIGIAHNLGNLARDLVHERLVHAHKRGKAQGATDKAAQHITAVFVGGQHATRNKKGRGAAVVGNNTQGRVHIVGVRGAEAVAHARKARGILDNVLKKIAVEVGALALGHGGHALKAHARVDIGSGQQAARAVGALVKLGEHEVPYFKKTVAVAVANAAIRATGHVCALIHIDFGARPAGAGVAHSPEIVFFAHAHNALGGQLGDFGPQLGGFVVFAKNRGPQLFFGQAQFYGDEIPGPGDGFALEIVAKGKVAEHFKKRVVARCAAHVFKVVVFARNPQALLAGGGAAVGAFFFTEKEFFELHHAGVGKEQRRVVGRNDRPGSDDFVLVAVKKVEIAAAYFFGGEHAGS